MRGALTAPSVFCPPFLKKSLKYDNRVRFRTFGEKH
nr:MAG TPA: hypothetical protein [Bacteriophage sp.]